MHLDEGRLHALVDGELPVEEARSARSHLAACVACRDLLEEVTGRMAAVSGAILRLDVPPPLLPAREAVRRRIDGSPRGASGGGAPVRRPGAPRRSPPWIRAAAALLLFTGAGVSALPGSPVREWVREWLATGPGAAGAPAASAVEAIPDPADDEVAVYLLPNSGEVRVELVSLPPGGEVRVEWVDRDDAAVVAPGGSRFETSPGRVQVAVAGSRVRVELPRSVPRALVLGNGERYLARSGDRLDVTGPVAGTSGDTLLFRLPGGGTPDGDLP